jgi:hypothetical protein
MTPRAPLSSSSVRKALLATAVAGVVGGCARSVPAEPTSAPGSAGAAPSGAPTTTLPSATAQVRSIFEAYARAPSTFDRLPHVSRFYVEQGKRADDACRAGAGCVADRFVCLDPLPDVPGVVEGAELVGELPGASASVRLRLRFGARTSSPTVDVVVEDGGWRIDQVRCPLESDSGSR